MKRKNLKGLVKAYRLICLLVLMCMPYNQANAQVYTIKNGKMYIEIKKGISDSALQQFIRDFELSDVGITRFFQTNQKDSLEMMGWSINRNDKNLFAISKELISAVDMANLADKIIFAEHPAGFAARFPATNNGLQYGYNKFRNKNFVSQDSTTTFFLRNHQDASRVMLAGSFNNWDPDKLAMKKTDSGWIARVKLGKGKYWYKFIADGQWMVDNDNQLKENDGQGNTNSVYYKPNYTFRLQGFEKAGKVILAGSFNNWDPRGTAMIRTANGWELPVYLANGTHTYRFIVDGNWMTDPGNTDKLPNEFNDYNSVVKLGNAHLFTLKGYPEARQVLLTGTFNGWRKYELYMKKTANGWELPYVIGPGNYEYRFIVDRKEIKDPDNPLATKSGKDGNSFLIFEPNYTFRLKGYPHAKSVYLAGDFNRFTPNSLLMKKDGDDWIFTIHLSRGKHLYKFIVDGEWIRDPNNKLWEQNNFKTGDSVIWIEN